MSKLILLRGLPGSGKSYYATKNYPDVSPFCADNFWQGDKGYYFDPKRIGEAHAWCFRNYLDSLAVNQLEDSLGSARIYIVDNTNICSYEIAPYIQAANAYGLDHEIVTILCDIDMAARRNVHEVPYSTIWKMYQSLLQEELPPFWKHMVVLQDDAANI